MIYLVIAFLVVVALSNKSASHGGASGHGDDSGNSEAIATGYIRGIPVQINVASIGQGFALEVNAASAFKRMMAAYGGAYVINSAFRSMLEQQLLYEAYLAGTGNQAARPGWSTHQAGRSVDLSVASYPELLAWLRRNAASFGFKEDVSNEPWHWTYTS